VTQIDFYTHVNDKLHTVCQLVAKAYERKLKVLVFTPDSGTSTKLDNMLWTANAIGFLPHAVASSEIAVESPIIIDHRGEDLVHDDVLVNLRNEWPPFFSRFQRLIEVVGLEENDRLAARERYSFYRDRGYPIKSHNLSN
jgi:DNA polymerase III subunit chi